eukprot:5590555-Alexandrium_andersonii.AAC.1
MLRIARCVLCLAWCAACCVLRVASEVLCACALVCLPACVLVRLCARAMLPRVHADVLEC